MNTPLEDQITVRDILLFDTVYAQCLTAGERISIHQFIGQGIQLSKNLEAKLQSFFWNMKDNKYESPECRYNVDRELEILNPGSSTWILLKSKIN